MSEVTEILQVSSFFNISLLNSSNIGSFERMQPKDSPAYTLFSGPRDGYFTGYTNFQNVRMLPAFERIPDWNNQSSFAVPTDASSPDAAGSAVNASRSAAAGSEMSDAAILKRVVPTLDEAEAQGLIDANAGDLKAAVTAALTLPALPKL